jgi:hypothetical protein
MRPLSQHLRSQISDAKERGLFFEICDLPFAIRSESTEAMPWTTADREIILDAIRDIAEGKRVTSVTTADRSETYQIADVGDLQKLLDTINANVQNRPRLLRSRYSKGL